MDVLGDIIRRLIKNPTDQFNLCTTIYTNVPQRLITFFGRTWPQAAGIWLLQKKSFQDAILTPIKSFL
jgi:hypothetical protein